jgi:hypothetical protein
MSKIFLFLFFLISFHGFGQPVKKVSFSGYALIIFDQPIEISRDQYKSYYKNDGQHFGDGVVTVDEQNKTFLIKWNNGDEWLAKYLKKETKSEYDDFLGSVERTLYFGTWTDIDVNCCLIVNKQFNGHCVLQIKSKKVIFPEYKIDDWKNIYTLYTQDKCLE